MNSKIEYKVIPFVASIDSKKGTSNHVAQQLEDLIKNYSNLGWKYERLESVTTFVQPDNGCFGIVGVKPGYTTTRQMVVFSK
ncbi:hypothetical protein [Flavobacterium sp.]|uniref:hypothetical protein n=1 Tax=Flavobacterium sp. TaxID=239 RepID=UPI0040482980